MKDGNPMITSISTEKVFNKIQHIFLIKMFNLDKYLIAKSGDVHPGG